MPSIEQKRAVHQWLSVAPFDDPVALQQHPDFSYQNWIREGKDLPHSVDVLVEILENENLASPSQNAEKAAYALGWLEDKRAHKSLMRALKSTNANLRSESIAALGRLGDADASGPLEKFAEDEREDTNVRANACIAIGELKTPHAEQILKTMLKHRDPFLARSAGEGLHLLRENKRNK
jgi:HEAT repeat protein